LNHGLSVPDALHVWHCNTITVNLVQPCLDSLFQICKSLLGLRLSERRKYGFRSSAVWRCVVCRWLPTFWTRVSSPYQDRSILPCRGRRFVPPKRF
jgi:hypothetical protein